jgi:acetolactate synthase-1/2/3 large subunit
VSFFGYAGVASTLAPPECAFHNLATPAEDGTAALAALADELGAHAAPPADEPAAPSLPHGEPLTADAVGRTVAALLPEGAILSDESVSSNEALWPHLRYAARHDYLPVTGGSIGQGLPVAAGAALACPDRKVIAIEADGSGMYTLQALWTMARERLDVVTVILANRRYRILEVEMRRTGAGAPGPLASCMIDIGNPQLDWVALANGQGVEASRAHTAGEFITQFRDAMNTRGPRLIEAVMASSNRG